MWHCLSRRIPAQLKLDVWFHPFGFTLTQNRRSKETEYKVDRVQGKRSTRETDPPQFLPRVNSPGNWSSLRLAWPTRVQPESHFLYRLQPRGRAIHGELARVVSSADWSRRLVGQSLAGLRGRDSSPSRLPNAHLPAEAARNPLRSPFFHFSGIDLP
jgi:hypothetical protein